MTTKSGNMRLGCTRFPFCGDIKMGFRTFLDLGVFFLFATFFLHEKKAGYFWDRGAYKIFVTLVCYFFVGLGVVYRSSTFLGIQLSRRGCVSSA